MTVEEEIEGNRIIHKFYTNKEHSLPFSTKYNLSWDKLMPVYQKLFILFNSPVFYVKACYTDLVNMFNSCYEGVAEGKSRQEVFESIVDCIKELNKLNERKEE